MTTTAPPITLLDCEDALNDTLNTLAAYSRRMDALDKAARFALDELADMTSDAFAHGADKALREALAAALEVS